MSDPNRPGIFEHTKEALQLLACPAQLQIRLLPEFVSVADELALDFNHWQSILLSNFSSELTQQQIAHLTAIDGEFDQLSREGARYDPEFWTNDALQTSSKWNSLRQMAVQVLHSFGWPVTTPPSHAAEYVKGSRNSGSNTAS
jgi:hypothetical protein